ncbi:MAG: hypothetical protein HZB23_15480 [Deltaproteobacteria bacterium]|nr:hypothetical protein [Deltaproteobacteria bacterium]
MNSQGILVLEPESNFPREIHGIASNAFLQTEFVLATAADKTSIFVIDQILRPPADVAHQRLGLKIVGQDDCKIAFPYLEEDFLPSEKDLAVALAGQGSTKAVGTRTLTRKTAAVIEPLELPAMDARASASWLLSPDAMGRDELVAKAGNALDIWYKGLDEGFLKRFTQTVSHNQKHLAGFRLNHIKEESKSESGSIEPKPQTILGRLTGLQGGFVDTKPQPMAMKMERANYSFGFESGSKEAARLVGVETPRDLLEKAMADVGALWKRAWVPDGGQEFLEILNWAGTPQDLQLFYASFRNQVMDSLCDLERKTEPCLRVYRAARVLLGVVDEVRKKLGAVTESNIKNQWKDLYLEILSWTPEKFQDEWNDLRKNFQKPSGKLDFRFLATAVSRALGAAERKGFTKAEAEVLPFTSLMQEVVEGVLLMGEKAVALCFKNTDEWNKFIEDAKTIFSDDKALLLFSEKWIQSARLEGAGAENHLWKDFCDCAALAAGFDMNMYVRIADFILSMAGDNSGIANVAKKLLAKSIQAEFDQRVKALASELKITVPMGWDESLQRLAKCWEGDYSELATQFPPLGDTYKKMTAQFEALRGHLGQMGYTPDLLEKVVNLREIPGFGPVNLDLLAQAIGVVKEEKGFARDAGHLLKSLANPDPPYVAVSSRFQAVYSPAFAGCIKDIQKFMSERLELCSLMDEKAWDLNLDNGETTVILKRSKSIRLSEILLELHQRYARLPDFPDPLGLWSSALKDKVDFEPGNDAWPKKLVDAWLERFVDEEVKKPGWLGLIILNPLADLSSDPMTSDLCGLRFIRVKYVALAGWGVRIDKPKSGRLADKLDIMATVFQEAPSEDGDANLTPVAGRDAGLSLVKFEAWIRNTRLVPTRTLIELRLDIDRLWGHRKDRFSSITIFGKVRQAADGSSSELEFGVVFDQALKLPIEVLFIKEVAVRSFRAGRRHGRATLEIDADLILRAIEASRLNVPDLKFQGPSGNGETKILFKSFRLMLPSSKGKNDMAMGTQRSLEFDFDSIEFKLGRPLELCLEFLDLRLKSMGFLRIKENAEGLLTAVQDLADRFPVLLSGFEIPSLAGGDYSLPYMVFDVSFGKLPALGAVSVGSLSLSALIGARVKLTAGDPEITPCVALGAVEIKRFRFDLFGILTFSFESLTFEPGYKSSLNNEEEYTVLLVNDFRLSLLGMDLIGGRNKKGGYLLFLHRKGGGSGVLAYLNFSKDLSKLLRVDWILVAYNMEVDPSILTCLLMSGTSRKAKEDADNAIMGDPHASPPKPGLVDKDCKKVKAALTGEKDWLFGISFTLGTSIIESGRLVLHQDHFYGISLSANWIEKAFDGDTITMAFIPGRNRKDDKFYLDIPMPKLDMLAPGFQAGWLTFSFTPGSLDFLMGFGFPWWANGMYQMTRSFSVMASGYESKFGFYVSKFSQGADKSLQLGGGIALYAGLGFAAGNSVAWVRAGIGVMAVMEGSITLSLDKTFSEAIDKVDLTVALGIYAYGEGGIDVWVISARFLVELQFVTKASLSWKRGAPMRFLAEATMAANYYASVTIGKGWFHYTFTVEGSVSVPVRKQLAISR